MLQSGVGKVYRLLQHEDGHVVLENSLASSYVELGMFLYFSRHRAGYEGFRLVLPGEVVIS